MKSFIIVNITSNYLFLFSFFLYFCQNRLGSANLFFCVFNKFFNSLITKYLFMMIAFMQYILFKKHVCTECHESINIPAMLRINDKCRTNREI